MSSESIDETKKIIRSLLISAKRGLFIHQLVKEYFFQKGTPIPYLLFGHTTLGSFLYSIPDVVSISRRGSLLHLVGVPTNETVHIARMVQQQLGRTTSIIRNSNPKSRYSATPSMSNTKFEKSCYIPSSIRHQVRDTLLVYPKGIEPDSFTHAYRNRYGYWLQYPRLGYTSVHDFVTSIPGVTIERVKSHELIFYSPTSVTKKRPPWLSRSDSQSPLIPPPAPFSSESNAPSPPNRFDIETPLVCETELNEAPIPVAAGDNSSAEFTVVSPTQTQGLSPPLDSSVQSQVSSTHKEMFEKISQEVSDILSNQSEEILIDVLETEYQDRCGKALPFVEFGFSSPLELIESLWDTCHLKRKHKTFFVSYIDRSRVQTEDSLPSERNSSRSRVDPDIGKRVRRLLQQWPCGMPYYLITEKYENLYREHLPGLELGFRDSLHMMLDIPDFVKVTPWNTGFGHSQYILSAVPNDEDLKELVPPPVLYIDTPSDYFDIPFEKQPVPQSWEFSVYLPFISSPDKFWIQIVGLKTTSITEVMLEELTQFYSNLSHPNIQRYRIGRPKVGQSCVAPYQRDSCYYRARILRIPHPDQAEVYYVDYGNKSRVPIGSLRKIDLSNMILPAQAIRCRLANVRPARGGHWPSGSADLLKDLANDSELLCRVQNIDPDDTLSVLLFDPSSDSGQSIDQILIARGIAAHENNTPLNPRAFATSGNIQTTAQAPPAHAPLVPSLHAPHIQPPGIMPPPYPYPFYNLPTYPYMNPLLPYMPPTYHHNYISPYMTPFTFPQERSYLSASVPTPQVPGYQPQHPSIVPQTHPTLNGSNGVQGDTYLLDKRDGRAKVRIAEQNLPELETNRHLELCQEMGSFEKVQKFLSTHKTPDELETQIKADREKLNSLKQSRGDLVTKQFDVNEKNEINHFISQLNKISSEIDQLEIKLSLSCPNSPAPDVTSPIPPSLSPPLEKQPPSKPPPTVAISMCRNLNSQGPIMKFKYKGIGRGEKMSDLV